MTGVGGPSGHAERHVLLVGAQRCGTTYLARALDAHPHVTLAQPSRPEPKVWCDPELAARGHEHYDATWFAHAGDDQLMLDKSTSYLEDPEAPARAAAALGVDPHLTPEPAAEPVNRSPGARPVLSGALRGTLQEYYAASNAALADSLGRDLPW